jgi:carbonic anhydrase/acetyltransferase-like protein (isoleucine patch superfamily)
MGTQVGLRRIIVKKAKMLFILLYITLFFVEIPVFADDVTVEVDPPDRLSNTTVLGEWSTPGVLDGWSGTNISGLTSTGGYITGTGTTSTPYIQKTVMSAPDLDFGYNDYLQIRIKVPAGFSDDIIFSFGTSTNTGFSTSREFIIPQANIPGDGNWHSYRLDLGLVVWWRDTLRDMQIKPLGNSGSGQTFYIDYVEVGDLPGDVLLINTDVGLASGETLADCSYMESKHAVFWWSPTSYTVDGGGFNPTVMGRRALRMIEESYQVYTKKMGFIEPCESWDLWRRDGNRYKTNHTTWFGGYWMGGRNGFGWLNVPRSGLGDEGWGNPVPHEYGHVFDGHQINFLTGGHWESHANHLQNNRNMYFSGPLGSHPTNIGISPFEFSNFRQDHGRLIYADYRIHQALQDYADDMGLPSNLAAQLWYQGTSEYTVYDKLATLLPGGYDVADVVTFGLRHWPFLDFPDGSKMATELWSSSNNKAWWYYITGSLLIPSQDRPGWWRVPFERAPEKFGYMYHELVPSDSNVTVELEGFDLLGSTEDWRWSLAAMDGAGNVRYSDVWAPGTHSLLLNPGETKVYLIVVPTPTDTSLNLEWTDNRLPVDKCADRLHYPYEVRIVGATPAKRQLGWAKGTGSYLPPAQGGGWKDNSAYVATTAWVGPNARVLGSGRVENYARVEDYAVVMESAKIQNYAVVSGYAVVRNNAIVRNYAKVRDRAVISGSSVIEGNAVVEDYSHTYDSTNIKNSAIARGLTLGVGGAVIYGTAIADYDLTIGHSISNGVHFSHVPWGDWYIPYYVDTKAKPNGLVASYRVEEPEGQVLWDEFGAQHALLRGAPTRPTDAYMNSPVLRLNGTSQYAVLDRSLCDLASGSFAIWVKPNGSNTNKPVLFMGASAGKYLKLVARNGSDKAEFTITDGTTTKTLTSASTVLTGSWTHLAVTLDGSQAKLYVNGGTPEATTSTTLVPDDCLGAGDYTVSEGFYIGRDYTGNLFAGDIEDARFYNVALTQSEIENEIRRSGDCIGAMYYNQEMVFNGVSTEVQSGVHDGQVRVLEAEVFPNTSDNVAYYEGIFDSSDEQNSTYQGCGFGLDNGKIVVRLENYGFWNTGVNITLGAWQKITLVYNGSTATLYVNDIERGSVNYSAAASDVAGKNFRIGFAQRESDDAKFYFDGKLRNVYIYDRVPVTGEPLPEPLQNQDIGLVGAAGSTSYQDGVFTVKGSGADIGDVADEFHYVFQPMTGNGQIVVRVLTLQNTGTEAKAGVMIRESLDSGSRNVLAGVTRSSGTFLQFRPDTGGPTYPLPPSGPAFEVPCWIKLVRCGDLFLAYGSDDGEVWSLFSGVMAPMAEDVYVGLAVTSNLDGMLCTVKFDQLQINDTLPADISGNGEVNFEDYAMFASEWLNTDCCQIDCDWCSRADLDMNGEVGFEDLALFTEQW